MNLRELRDRIYELGPDARPMLIAVAAEVQQYWVRGGSSLLRATRNNAPSAEWFWAYEDHSDHLRKVNLELFNEPDATNHELEQNRPRLVSLSLAGDAIKNLCFAYRSLGQIEDEYHLAETASTGTWGVTCAVGAKLRLMPQNVPLDGAGYYETWFRRYLDISLNGPQWPGAPLWALQLAVAPVEKGLEIIDFVKLTIMQEVRRQATYAEYPEIVDEMAAVLDQTRAAKPMEAEARLMADTFVELIPLYDAAMARSAEILLMASNALLFFSHAITGRNILAAGGGEYDFVPIEGVFGEEVEEGPLTRTARAVELMAFVHALANTSAGTVEFRRKGYVTPIVLSTPQAKRMADSLLRQWWE